MISTVSESTLQKSGRKCAECGALLGSPEAPRIIISFCGDVHRCLMAVGHVRRLSLGFGLKLWVNHTTEPRENTPSMWSTCMISAPADFISLYTKPTSGLLSTIRSKAVEHGALFDVINYSYGQSSLRNYPSIRHNSFDEFCGNIGNGGKLYSPSKNRGKVWGLWLARVVPFPHFCQWKKLHASARSWSVTWSPQAFTTQSDFSEKLFGQFRPN